MADGFIRKITRRFSRKKVELIEEESQDLPVIDSESLVKFSDESGAIITPYYSGTEKCVHIAFSFNTPKLMKGTLTVKDAITGKYKRVTIKRKTTGFYAKDGKLL